MDYLFFDIECSDGHSMCSFGYVLTDDRFNIKEKKDILINPESHFQTKPWSKKAQEKDAGITLAYPVAVFRSHPAFPDRYPDLCALLGRENQRIIGFSHANDANFLNLACKRYELPAVRYEFFDLQKAYCRAHEMKNQIGLQKLLEEFGIDTSAYVAHRSDDDAEVSMLVAKAVCAAQNADMEALIAAYPNSVGEVKDYECKYTGWQAEAKLRENRMNGKNRHDFLELLSKTTPQSGSDPFFAGRVFVVNQNFEKNHFAEVCELVRALGARGARYSMRSGEAQVYATIADEDESVGRLAAVRQRLSAGAKVELVTLEELFASLGMLYPH